VAIEQVTGGHRELPRRGAGLAKPRQGGALQISEVEPRDVPRGADDTVRDEGHEEHGDHAEGGFDAFTTPLE
jgi:hypothetical protein